MHRSIIESANEEYGITLQAAPKAIERGYLSNNFRLQSDISSYFLKQYRFDHPERVQAAHEAKFFFAAAGVPVILPLRTRHGNSFFEFDQRFYALFPYIEGRHLQRGCFSRRAIESSAEMLARIHQAGKNAPVTYVKARSAVRNKAQFDETAQWILAKLSQSQATEFDQLAFETIQLKMHLATRHRGDFDEIDLPSDHLVHGDYQDANLFFDAADHVSHVFDWELTRVIHRGLELVRAMEFICFANPDNFKAVFSAENYEQARWFLQCYHTNYPITRNEFARVWRARYLDKVLSLWVEEDHYLHDNARVDPFLEAEYHAVHYYSEHLAEHIERLCVGILR